MMIHAGEGVPPCRHCLDDSASATSMSSTFFMASCLFLFGFLCSSMHNKTATDTQLSPFMRPRRRKFSLEPRKKATKALTISQQHGDFANLPQTVLHEILMFLDAKDIIPCTMLNSMWKQSLGSDESMLWQRIFRRDFGEDGRRFNAPCGFSWQEYYFQHRHTRPIERIKLLVGKQCVAVNGQVYDVTDFLYEHPGGHRVIADVLGTDATEVWLEFEHSESARESMKQLLVPDDTCKAYPLQGNLERIANRRHGFFKRWLRKYVPSMRHVS